MKPEAQLRALLEWLGWNDIELYQPRAEFMEDTPPAFWRGHSPDSSLWQCFPPLTLDLMHEAEEKLNDDQKTEYGNHLWDLCHQARHGDRPYWFLFHATKEQRLEAMIRTLNLWRGKRGGVK